MPIVGARAGPNHVRKVTGLVVTIAGHRFGFMNVALSRHSAIELPQRLIGCPARLVEGDGQVYTVILHALETTDGLAEDDPLARIFVGELKNFLTGAHLIGGENGKRFFQSLVDDLPSGARANDVSGWHLYLVELHFGHRNGETGVNI